MSFEDDFLYPLILLIIGGGLTGLLIPLALSRHESSQKRIDREREDHQKELDIKSDIVKNMSKAYAIAVSQLNALIDKIPHNSKKQFQTTIGTDTYREFFQEAAMVSSTLKAYFKNSNIYDEWSDFTFGLTNLWEVFDASARGDSITNDLYDSTQQCFRNYTGVNWEEFKKGNFKTQVWTEIAMILPQIRTEIIDKVLREKIDQTTELIEVNSSSSIPIKTENGITIYPNGLKIDSRGTFWR